MSISAAASTHPRDREATHSIERLSALAPMQAVALYEAMTTLVDVLDGLLCQPRFSGPHNLCNAAGQELFDLRDQLREAAEAAIGSAARAEPRDRFERLLWAEALMRHAAIRADTVEELVAFAQSLAIPRS